MAAAANQPGFDVSVCVFVCLCIVQAWSLTIRMRERDLKNIWADYRMNEVCDHTNQLVVQHFPLSVTQNKQK